MSRRTSEDLIRALAGDLRPVRPLPRLRVIAGATLALAAASVLLYIGVGAGTARAGTWGDPTFGLVFSGLLLTGVGGVVAALAASIPGRESLVRAAGAVGATGFALAVGAGASALASGGAATTPLAGPTASCIARAVLLGLLPGLAVVAWIGRAFAHRPGAAAAAASVACVALGAVTAHATCATGGAGHVLVGHALAPLLGGAALALPLAWLAMRTPRI